MSPAVKSVSRFLLVLLLLLVFAVSASADAYNASTMRLLRHEGDVEIFDVSGEPRFIMDNVRFSSGESMRTGGDGKASVSLDDSKIVTLDASSRVEFIQEADHIRLNLTEGSLFLDVSEKLDENEGLDIQTTTMTVGIRGTVIFLSVLPSRDNPDLLITTLGVLEGTAEISYTDAVGTSRRLPVSAGKTAKITGRKKTAKDGSALSSRAVDAQFNDLTVEDVKGFVTDQVMGDQSLMNRITEGSQQVGDVLSGKDSGTGEENQFPADGDWTWSGKVVLIAQSASKLYDGTPLARPSDVLVYGLPGNFNINVSASGSLTDAGSTSNVVSSYTITNAKGENVTAHFTNVEKVPGTLVVDPAPLVIWTGSAEKHYDGEPLTCQDAEIRTVPGHSADDPAWQNTSLVTQTALGSETMVAVSGTTLVHGTNPLTGETQQLELQAGQSLSVCLHDSAEGQSLEFQVTTLTEYQLPEEVLRLYADNPDLLAEACLQTGWNPDVMAGLIADLPAADTANVTRAGLSVSGESQSGLMTDSTNVRIHIDSEITNYETRPLSDEEANFTPIVLDPSIVITATGSQTEIGESENTYTIDWGRANKNNYVLREDLGTLTVLPERQEITVTARSAEKVYDGAELTAGGYSVKGLPEGYTLRASVTGAITEAGEASNEISYVQILDAEEADAADDFIVRKVAGTLTVNPLKISVSLGGKATIPYTGSVYVPSPVATYTNGEHAGDTVPATRLAVGPAVRYVASAGGTPRLAKGAGDMLFRFTLFTGDSVDLTLSAISTEPGTYTFTGSVSSSTASVECPSLDFSSEQVTVESADLTITTGSAEKPYDGEPLTSEDVTITGLMDGDEISVTVTGTQTDAGESENTFTVDWGAVDKTKYTVTENPGTLKVTPMAVVINLDGGSLSYGEDYEPAITADCGGRTVEVSSNREDDCYEASFSIPAEADSEVTFTVSDYPYAGDHANTTWNLTHSDPEFVSGTASNYNIAFTNDTVTVVPAEITVVKESESRTYDGLPGPATTDCSFDPAPFDWDISVELSSDNLGPDVGTYSFDCTVDLGDHANDYTVKKDLGSLEITPASLTISTPEKSKDYDGEPLTVDETDITVTGLASGESIQVPLSKNSVTHAGTVTPEFGEIVWSNAKQSNYTVAEQSPGDLTVNPAPLTFYCGGKTVDYGELYDLSFYVDYGTGKIQSDGYSWTGDITQAEFDLLGTDHAVLTVSGFETKPGEYTLSTSWDMTSGSKTDYTVSFEDTAWTVSKIPVTITISSPAAKDYDGTRVSVDSSWIRAEDDPYEQITYRELGSDKVDAGTYENAYEINYNGANQNYYEITVNPGTITINPLPLTVRTGGAEKTYNNQPLTNAEASLSGLLSGETATVEATGSQTNAGSSPNTYKITWVSAKESNYTITEDLGYLYVEQANITVTTGSDSKPYDGTPLTNSDYDVSEWFYPDHLYFTCTGSQTEVGTSENWCVPDFDHSVGYDNYNITFVYGELEVTY